MRRRKKKKIELGIPAKANRILNGILIALSLIAFRLWQVSIFQHEEKKEAALKPQKRTVIERAERATIRDRFDQILATNKVQYNAAISYGEIREVPRVIWKKSPEGKKIKIPRRKEYISELADLLAKELELDGEKLEDLIHSKASVFGSVPFVIKENISEKEYFRLKMLEKDWPGVHADHVAKRNYPLGPTGGEVIGYLGAISSREYEAITKELRFLREALRQSEEGETFQLPEGYTSLAEVEKRLKDLEGKAYGLNDYVGKAGIEGAFDEELRGQRGRRFYLSDIKGNFLQELPGAEPSMPGNRLYLSISAELQEYAERLLAEYEGAPPGPRVVSLRAQGLIPMKQPWIKGGAIVAMHPKTGEILALASYPRFNPNDFIRSGSARENDEKRNRVNHWLENETHLGSIWDLKQPLKRERFDVTSGEFYEESTFMDWEQFLDLILPAKSSLRLNLDKVGVGNAIFLQNKVQEMLELFPSSISPTKIFDSIFCGEEDILTSSISTLAEKRQIQNVLMQKNEQIDRFKNDVRFFFQGICLNEEKLMLVDLSRLAVHADLFSPELVDRLKKLSLKEFREISARLSSIKEGVRNLIKEEFHHNHFKIWREEHFKAFLAEKRKIESKEKKKFGKPYIEYLEEAEANLFQTFWDTYRWSFLTAFLGSDPVQFPAELASYFHLLGDWKKKGVEKAPWLSHLERLNFLLKGFDGSELTGCLKTLRSFEDLQRPLLGKYGGVRSHDGKQLEKHLAISFYPLYGYGFVRSQAFREGTTIGSIFKLVPAYEALRQRYLKMQEKHEFGDLNPFVMVDDKHRVPGKGEGWIVGFSSDGKPIPRFYHGGLLPRSEHPGIGRVDLVKALEASSNPYFSILAGDILEDPEDMWHAAETLGYGAKTGIDLPGEISGSIPADLAYNRTGLYSFAIGQHSLVGTPLQTAVMLSALANGGHILKPKIVTQEKVLDQMIAVPTEERWQIFLPSPIRHLLLTGLKQVVTGEKGTARSLNKQFPLSLISKFIGKTSTAEVTERLGIGSNRGVKFKNVWFGAICFDSLQHFSDPDLVVVVYLRFGEFGKEAAPLAAKMAAKWKEILARHPGG